MNAERKGGKIHDGAASTGFCSVEPDVIGHRLPGVHAQAAPISWETGRGAGDINPARNGKNRLWLCSRQLLCHCDLDRSAHGANAYILDLDHELPPFVDEREPGPRLDRFPQPKTLCTGPAVVTRRGTASRERGEDQG